MLADGASVQLLAYLLRTLAPAPGFSAPGDEGFTGLFVATQLDGDVGGSRVPAWMTDVAATVIAVGGLDLEGIRALLSSPAVLEKLALASGGVPRRLEALLEQRPPDADAILADRVAALSRPTLIDAFFRRYLAIAPPEFALATAAHPRRERVAALAA